MAHSFEHQKTAVGLSAPRAFYAYFMEMGTGKTKTDIDDTEIQHRTAGMDGWLITAPKGTYTSWLGQLREHLPPDILARARIYQWQGGKTRREELDLEDVCTPRAGGGLRIFVMNVEALSVKRGGRALVAARQFLKSCRHPKMTVDEATTIKTWDSNRSIYCKELGRLAHWRRILTGMPVTKSPLDVYSQFDFLEPGVLGYRSFFAFRAAYAVMKEIMVGVRRVKIVVNYRNLPDLRERMAPHSFRVTKDQCLDLPPKVYQFRDATMTDEQWRIYRAVRDEATAELDSGDHVTATEVMTQLLRLHQVTLGFVKDENGVVHDVPCTRYDDLLDLLEETSGKVLIWANYKKNVAEIVRRISEKKREGALVWGPRSVVQYDGSVSDRDRVLAIRRFQGDEAGRDDPECRFFVANAATGGFGLTLTRASTAIYFSNGYSLEHRKQSEDRCHRIGQNNSVNYVDLRAIGTVDEKIISALRKGIDIASVIVGDGYQKWLV